MVHWRSPYETGTEQQLCCTTLRAATLRSVLKHRKQKGNTTVFYCKALPRMFGDYPFIMQTNLCPWSMMGQWQSWQWSYDKHTSETFSIWVFRGNSNSGMHGLRKLKLNQFLLVLPMRKNRKSILWTLSHSKRYKSYIPIQQSNRVQWKGCNSNWLGILYAHSKYCCICFCTSSKLRTAAHTAVLMTVLVSLWLSSIIKDKSVIDDTFEHVKMDFPPNSSKTMITIMFSIISNSLVNMELL